MTRDEKLRYQAEASRRHRERNKDNAEYRARMSAYQKKYYRSKKGKATEKRFTSKDGAKEYRDARKKTPFYKYSDHMYRSKARKIEWLFTFDTWWKMWKPYWDRRGTACNDLQMCRHGDSGPYSPENVRIDTCANNAREMWEVLRAKK